MAVKSMEIEVYVMLCDAVRRTRVSLGNCCSIQLSYGDAVRHPYSNPERQEPNLTIAGGPPPLDLTLRPADIVDIAAIARLHALAFATLAADRHSAQQIASHTRLTAAPEYERELLQSHLGLA